MDYVFSDKTGTLTENKLVLKKCSIRGTMYDASGPSSRHVAKTKEEGKAWQADGGRGKEEEESRETLNVHDDDAFPLEEVPGLTPPTTPLSLVSHPPPDSLGQSASSSLACGIGLLNYNAQRHTTHPGA